MADDLTASFVIIQDQVLEHLNDLVKTWIKTPIEASLTVTGHDYWVVLEYGSAPAEEGPREPQNGDDVDVIIAIPSFIPRPHTPTDHTVELHNGTTITSKWYPIRARNKKSLHFIDRHGVERFDTVVYHPGIKARGFLRRAIRAWQYRVLVEFEALDQELGDDLPERRDLVTLINRNLRILLKDVQEATPVGDKHDPRRDAEPLAAAWGIIPAR